VCFGEQAEHVVASLARGARAIAVGSPRTRAWTTGEGEDRSVLEIVADEIGPSLRWAEVTRTTEVTRATG
jgi:single-strand DNA-binding protein